MGHCCMFNCIVAENIQGNSVKTDSSHVQQILHCKHITQCNVQAVVLKIQQRLSFILQKRSSALGSFCIQEDTYKPL